MTHVAYRSTWAMVFGPNHSPTLLPRSMPCTAIRWMEKEPSFRSRNLLRIYTETYTLSLSLQPVPLVVQQWKWGTHCPVPQVSTLFLLPAPLCVLHNHASCDGHVTVTWQVPTWLQVFPDECLR